MVWKESGLQEKERKKKLSGNTPALLLHSEHVSSKTVINTLDSFWLFTRRISGFSAEAAPWLWPAANVQCSLMQTVTLSKYQFIHAQIKIENCEGVTAVTLKAS